MQPHFYLDFIYFDFTSARRVLVVGDIHGEFIRLKEELDKLGFDPNQDILVSVGDLTDRGPYSHLYTDWIYQPFFYRVLGNHDIMPRMYLNGVVSKADIERWGGGWFVDLPQEEIEAIADDLENAPLSLTIRTPGGYQIGIVHADCVNNWNRHVVTRVKQDTTPWIQDFCLWSRETINNACNDLKKDGKYWHNDVLVSGIDHVFHGHTILPEVTTFGNRTWIDTGAFAGGPLTVLDVDQFLKSLPHDK